MLLLDIFLQIVHFFTFLLVNKKFKAMNLPLPSALAELNFFSLSFFPFL